MKKCWFAIGVNDNGKVHTSSVSGMKTSKEDAIEYAKKQLHQHSDFRVTRVIIVESTDVVMITEPMFSTEPILSDEQAAAKMTNDSREVIEIAKKQLPDLGSSAVQAELERIAADEAKEFPPSPVQEAASMTRFAAVF